MAAARLAVRRTRQQAPRLGKAAALRLIDNWRYAAPIGTEVRYFPTWGQWEEHRADHIERPASLLPSGAPVLWLRLAGCVSAHHCEPIAVTVEPPSQSEVRR